MLEALVKSGVPGCGLAFAVAPLIACPSADLLWPKAPEARLPAEEPPADDFPLRHGPLPAQNGPPPVVTVEPEPPALLGAAVERCWATAREATKRITEPKSILILVMEFVLLFEANCL
jgi:hypothetical protein